MTDTCHECGEEYTRLATHWTQSGCQHKPLSDYQKEVVTGLVMGDGCVAIQDDNKYPYLIVALTKRDYLEYLSNSVFPLVSHEATMSNTAKECADSGGAFHSSTDAHVKDYSSMYRLNTMSHPDFANYRKWYSSGSKSFPKNIELTPTVLKHWYCGDGHLIKNSGRASIAMSNERDSRSKIVDMFKRAGFEDFSWYRYELQRDTKDNAEVRFSNEETKWFFRYMGDPPPGFEYKWL